MGYRAQPCLANPCGLRFGPNQASMTPPEPWVSSDLNNPSLPLLYLCHHVASDTPGQSSRNTTQGGSCSTLGQFPAGDRGTGQWVDGGSWCGGRCDLVLPDGITWSGTLTGYRPCRHSSAIPDGTLRLFRRISNRRSLWNADGVGACETVCPFSDSSFAWETKPVSTNPRAQPNEGLISLRSGLETRAELFCNRTLQRKIGGSREKVAFGLNLVIRTEPQFRIPRGSLVALSPPPGTPKRPWGSISLSRRAVQALPVEMD